jgi:O-antigen/teichoic acid export membrane protein
MSAQGGMFDRVRTGVMWSAGTFFAGRGLTFISMLILARVLTPDDFGVVAAIIVFLGIIELGSDVGMNATIVYEQESGVTPRVQTAFTLNLLAATALTAIGVAVAPLVAALFNMEAHTDLFRLSALSLLGIGLGNVHDGLLMRELDFRRRAIPGIVRAIVRGIVSIALALAGLGAAALVAGMLAGTAVWTVALWVLVPLRPTFRLDRGIARSMVGYGAGAAVLEVVAVLASRTDAIVVGRVLGERALGLYSMAFRLPELLIASISWNISTVAFPALARKRANDDAAGLGNATLTQLRFQCVFAIPVAAGLAVLASPLVVTLFGDQWAQAGPVMSAVAVASGLTAIAFPLGDVFKAIGRQWTIVTMNLIQLPLLIGVMIAVAPAGIVAVAWARAGISALFAFALIGAVMRALHLRVRPVLASIWPALAAGAGVAAGAGAVRLAWPSLSIGPVIAGTVAAALCGAAALRLVAPEALDDLRRLLPGRLRARPAAATASER